MAEVVVVGLSSVRAHCSEARQEGLPARCARGRPRHLAPMRHGLYSGEAGALGPGPGGRPGTIAEMRRLALLALAVAVSGAACGTGRSPDPPAGRVDSAYRPDVAARSPSPVWRGIRRYRRVPVFHGSSQPIDPQTRARMTSSWRPGCPVAIEDLRLLTVSHWGFDGRVRRGELVVHRAHAGGVLSVMRRLFEVRFPIERMQLVDVYGGDDDRSMAANNTSAFNCRAVSGQPGTWSEHAYGWAIDVNPVQNPYVRGGEVRPPNGAPFANRSRQAPGMIHSGDAVVRAFGSIGWEWGGNWRSAKDYQHFSATGR